MRSQIAIEPYSAFDAERILGPRHEYPAWVYNRDKHGPAYTITNNGHIVCCAGLMLYGDYSGEAWLLPGPRFLRHAKSVVRATHRWLEKWQRDYGLVRLQATVDADNTAAIRFVEHYGFEREGLLRGAGPGASDLLMYARIRRGHVEKSI